MRRCREFRDTVSVLLTTLGSLLAPGPAAAEQLAGTLREVRIRYTGGCINQQDTSFPETVSPSAAGSDTRTLSCYGSTGTLTVSWSFPATLPPVEPFGTYAPPVSYTVGAVGQWTTPPAPFAGPPYSLTVTAHNLATCFDREESKTLQKGTHTLAAETTCTRATAPFGAGTQPFLSLGGGLSAGPSWGIVSATGQAIYDFAPPTGGPDLDVDVVPDTAHTLSEPPVYVVTVTNRGGQPASEARVALVAGCRGFAPSVRSDPAATCTFTPRFFSTDGDCLLGALPPGASATFRVVVDRPLEIRTSATTSLAARTSSVPPDAAPENDTASASQDYVDCDSEAEGCPVVRVACDATARELRPRAASSSWLARSVASAVGALARSVVDVTAYRRLRDEVFGKTAAGRRYRELYAAHGAEVASLVGTNPALLASMLQGLVGWQGNVSALLAGQGASARVTQEQVGSLTDVLTRLKSLGSPALREVLAREEAALGLPSLAGTTMTEALARQEATAPATVTVPAAASIHGVAPAFFHSDLRVLNPSPGAPVSVVARYRCFRGPCPSALERRFTVAARELKLFDDVVVSLFAAPETAGAIELTGAVLAESRVYTPERPAPTSGSDVPGLPADEAYGESVLLALSKGDFRTNVGVTNAGAATVTATVAVHAPDGRRLGETSRSVPAGSAVQVDDVFGAAGIDRSVPDAYAVVKADGVAELFAYATVIDNRSQDSFFVKGRNALGTAASRVTIPAAASIHGIPPAFFHTDVRVFNPSATAAATVTARYRCFRGGCPGSLERTLTVAPREMKVIDDAVASLFGAPETAGAIELSGDVHVESRVYTPARTDPTTGTAVPGLPDSEATTEAALLSLSHSATPGQGFRTNAGVFNAGTDAFDATISLRRPDGTEMAKVTRRVEPQTSVQVDDVFGAAGVAADVPAAWALVTGDGSTPFFAYATVIDNQSQDSVFVKGRALRAP